MSKILLREYRPHLLANAISYGPNSTQPVICFIQCQSLNHKFTEFAQSAQDGQAEFLG